MHAAVAHAVLFYAYATEPTDVRIYAQRKAWHWCGPTHEQAALAGLDDAGCVKRFPAQFDRDWACPAQFDRDPAFGPAARNISALLLADPASPLPNVDLGALDGVVAPDVHAAVVVVRRGAAAAPGAGLAVRYLGNAHAATPHQPWSATKILAASAASMAMRGQQQQQQQHHHRHQEQHGGGHGAVGLESACNASGGALRLGDMLTTCCSYDTTLGISSNQVGAYFHSVGGHAHAQRVARQWLGVPAGESFGGDYGEALPPRLAAARRFANSAEAAQPCAAPLVLPSLDPPPSPPLANQLSALSMAEWMRRIVLAREEEEEEEEEEEQQGGGGAGGGGGMAWEDAAAILYGGSSKDASAFGGGALLQWGGASMSSDVYLQRAAGIDGSGSGAAEKAAAEQWRVFSKLGFGFSDTRAQFELTLNGYSCLPVLDQATHEPVPNRGLEFAISLWVADAKHQDGGRALDARFQEAVTNVTEYLLAKYN
jgi:hypothetical protein